MSAVNCQRSERTPDNCRRVFSRKANFSLRS